MGGHFNKFNTYQKGETGMSMDDIKNLHIFNPKSEKLRKVTPDELYKNKTPRLLRSSILLPSQYNSYAVCTEFARDWFLEKWPRNFFNSIYMDGSKSFDQFRMFSKIDDRLKRTNPVLAIVPTIDMNHNRNFIDTNMEMGGYLRRSRMEGTIFADKRPDKGLYLAVQFKTIIMNFTYRMRVDTKAEQLDVMEFIKYKHRAGLTENQYISLDVLVPKKIISQIAFDNAIATDDFAGPKDPDEMLRYLNSRSIVPFLYKRRNATGTGEYFIRIENCGVHIKAEMPNADENGERQDAETIAYTLDFSVEIEMTAPYCYTYYSQHEQNIINSVDTNVNDETAILLMKAVRGDLPECNEVGWNQLIKTEYIVEIGDLKDYVTIDFNELLKGELLDIVNYTRSIALSPSLFLDFIIFNNDSYKGYKIDWENNTLTLTEKCDHPGFIIGIYADMGYINNVKIHHNFADGFESPGNFRTTARINKIE